LSRARAESRLAVALSSACFDATWRLASSLPFVFRFRLLQCRLCGGLGGLRLLEPELVRLGLDDEEDRPLLHLVAVLIIDFLQESLYPRDQIGGVYRRGIAGGLEIAGDFLLYRHCDSNLRWWRRHIAVLLPAGREHQSERGRGGASDNM